MEKSTKDKNSLQKNKIKITIGVIKVLNPLPLKKCKPKEWGAQSSCAGYLIWGIYSENNFPQVHKDWSTRRKSSRFEAATVLGNSTKVSHRRPPMKTTARPKPILNSTSIFLSSHLKTEKKYMFTSIVCIENVQNL